MKNSVQVFKNGELGELKVIEVNDGELWFVGKEVAKILGYSETSVMLRRLDEDEKSKIEPTLIVGTNNMAREITIINESGLYSSILGSKLPQAKQFKKWVTSEVLPTLRKTGKYELQESPTSELQQIATNTLLQIAYQADNLVNKTNKLDNYYIPKHKTKLGYNKIIKTCLANNDTKKNCKLAKETLLLKLGRFNTYEEVPIDILENSNTIGLIYDICKNINITCGGIL